MRLNKKTAGLLLLAALLGFLLCACAKPKASSDRDVFQSTPEPTAAPTPTPVPMVDVGGAEFPADTRTLDLSDEEYLADVLCENSRYFTDVKELRLGLVTMEAWELERILEAYPDAEISWEAELFGKACPSGTEELDLSDMTEEQVDEAAKVLELLPHLKVVNLVPETGVTTLKPKTLDRLRAVRPEAEFRCCWELYGQLASWKTRELRYSKAKIGNDGIDVFREALPYLYSLELLRFYACGINDYDAMVQLNDDFPEVNVVFSVVIAGYNFMTDTILFHCPLLRDKHVELMKYLPNVIYLDIGHNRYITSVDFIKYLPKLQIVILSITKIKDISVLANCPDLEYVELLNTYIEDLSPLAELKKVEYLNIGDMPFVRDISPVYGMKSLKMVRICMRTYDHVHPDQVQKLKEALPDCFVSDGPGDPTTSGY